MKSSGSSWQLGASYGFQFNRWEDFRQEAGSASSWEAVFAVHGEEVANAMIHKIVSRGAWRTMLRSGEAPLGFRQAPPPPVPMPMSHFLGRPRRAAATRTNAAIDASRRGANVNF